MVSQATAPGEVTSTTVMGRKYGLVLFVAT